MAKVSSIEKNNRRIKLSSRNFKKREELKATVKDSTKSSDERILAQYMLQSLPRDESPCRVRNRCNHCGRPRGVYRYLGLCRCCIRVYMSKGWIPGFTMSSW